MQVIEADVLSISRTILSLSSIFILEGSSVAKRSFPFGVKLAGLSSGFLLFCYLCEVIVVSSSNPSPISVGFIIAA